MSKSCLSPEYLPVELGGWTPQGAVVRHRSLEVQPVIYQLEVIIRNF